MNLPVQQSSSNTGSGSGTPQASQQPKYNQLLAVLEELGKDIRPTYTGNKLSAERLKRSIIHARILVRECLMEADKAQQQKH